MPRPLDRGPFLGRGGKAVSVLFRTYIARQAARPEHLGSIGFRVTGPSIWRQGGHWWETQRHGQWVPGWLLNEGQNRLWIQYRDGLSRERRSVFCHQARAFAVAAGRDGEGCRLLVDRIGPILELPDGGKFEVTRLVGHECGGGGLGRGDRSIGMLLPRAGRSEVSRI